MIDAPASTPQQLISIVACVGIALSASEELVMRPMYADSGLLSWPVLRVARRRSAAPRAQDLLDHLFGPKAFVALLGLKLGTALALATLTLAHPHAHLAAGLLAGAMLAELVLMKRRSTFGLDGADQMYVVIFLGLTVYDLLPHGSLASAAGILYIGTQAVLAYLIAGIAKLAGPSWRDGSAIGGIMTTKIYGNRTAAAVLRGRAGPGRAACWTVIAFEVTFVAVLFVDRRTMWIMLGVAVLFNASTAVLMGLNSFFMAFVASYPAVAYANALMHRFVL